jgi:hypothetical protein
MSDAKQFSGSRDLTLRSFQCLSKSCNIRCIEETTMRKTIQTLVLILALTGIAHAGEMLTPAAPPPPPAQGEMG